MSPCTLCKQPADGEAGQFEIPLRGAVYKVALDLCARCSAASWAMTSREATLLWRRALCVAGALAGEAKGSA